MPGTRKTAPAGPDNTQDPDLSTPDVPDAPAPETTETAVPDAPVALGVAAVTDEPTGKYYVKSAGAPYMVNGEPGYVLIAMHGHVIDLVDSEAMRLLALDAIRAATPEEVDADRARRQREADIVASNTAGPKDNPFGGRLVGTSLEDHAAEQIKLARKAAKA